MNSIIHKANSRGGHSNHGWLDSYHSFSFANYHNPGRMNFGVLRVLNDDIVAGGTGFWPPSAQQYGDYYPSAARRSGT